MRKSAVVLVLTLALTAAMAGSMRADETSQCITCHKDLDEELSWPVAAFEEDVHKAAGLGCHDCHGGDPTTWDPQQAHAVENGFRRVESPAEITEFCETFIS